jgi:hypothetical protein
MSFADALKDLTTNQAMRQKYGDSLCSDFNYEGNRFNFVTTLHMKVLACDHMMSSNPFEYTLRKLAAEKHWEITDMRQHSKEKLKLDDGKKELQLRYRNLLQATIECECSWSDISERAQTGMYGPTDCEMAEIIVVLQRFGWFLQNDETRTKIVQTLIDDERVKDVHRLTIGRNMKQLRDAALFRTYIQLGCPKQMKKLDLSQLRQGGVPSNFTAIHHETFKHIEPMCRILGLNGVFDFETEFLIDKIDDLETMLKEIDHKNKSKKVRTVFQNVLKAVGLCYEWTKTRRGAKKVRVLRLQPIEDVYKYIEFYDLSYVEKCVDSIDRRLPEAFDAEAIESVALPLTPLTHKREREVGQNHTWDTTTKRMRFDIAAIMASS